eukprot:Hpha_TRINITY_DN16809_c0_g2::TRINITY_DN16809_c0_g2_i1::g.151793::m.151793
MKAWDGSGSGSLALPEEGESPPTMPNSPTQLDMATMVRTQEVSPPLRPPSMSGGGSPPKHTSPRTVLTQMTDSPQVPTVRFAPPGYSPPPNNSPQPASANMSSLWRSPTHTPLGSTPLLPSNVSMRTQSFPRVTTQDDSVRESYRSTVSEGSAEETLAPAPSRAGQCTAVAVSVALLSAGVAPHFAVGASFDNARDFGAFLFILVSAAAACFTVYRNRPPPPVMMTGAVLVVCFYDWSQSSLLEGRVWPLGIPFLLMFEEQTWRLSACTFLGAWLLLERVEAAWDFGLQNGADLSGGKVPDVCRCAAPPCSIPKENAMLEWFVWVMMLASVFLAGGWCKESRSLKSMAREEELLSLVVNEVSVHKFESAHTVLLDEDSKDVASTLIDALTLFVATAQTVSRYIPFSSRPTDDDTKHLPPSPISSREVKKQGPRPPAIDVNSDPDDLPMSGALTPRIGLSKVTASTAGMILLSPSPSPAISPGGGMFRMFNSPGVAEVMFSPKGAAGHASDVFRRRSGPLSRKMSSNTIVPKLGRRSFNPFLAVVNIPSRSLVSLAIINCKGFLDFVSNSDIAPVQFHFQSEIPRLADIALKYRGVVDTVLADHTYVSFGTSRSCATHASSAAGCCFSAVKSEGSQNYLEMNASACSGRVLHGDFGGTGIARFLLIGRLCSFAAITERVGCQLDVPIIINSALKNDVEPFYACRLRGYVRYAKTPTQEPVRLWELCKERDRVGEAAGCEWMYALAGAAPDPWEAYNRAFIIWADGDPKGAARRLTEDITEHSPQVVRAAASELASRIASSGAGSCAMTITDIVMSTEGRPASLTNQPASPIRQRECSFGGANEKE